MRRTTENLERLTDLRDELERQLQHLQRQAAAAEKYTEFKTEERELQAQLQALQWRELDGQLRAASQAIGELGGKTRGGACGTPAGRHRDRAAPGGAH